MARNEATNNIITVTFNKAEGGIELRIPYGRVLNAEERAELKNFQFSWAKSKHLWYTLYTEEKFEAMKNSKFEFLSTAKYPGKLTPNALKELEGNAERKLKARAAKAEARKAEKASTAADIRSLMAEIAELKAMLAQK